MMKWVYNNIDLSIKYSRYGFIACLIIFISLGSSFYPTIGERIFLSVFFVIGYFMFLYSFKLFLIMQKKIQKNSWNRAKKFLILQSNILMYFGLIGTVLFTFGLIYTVDFANLVMINISIVMSLGSIKARKIYLED